MAVRKFALLISLAAILAVCVAGTPPPHLQSSAQSNQQLQLPALKLAENIQWMLVNPKPYHVSSALDILCRSPLPDELTRERQKNPHASTDIQVYVNPIAREAMFSAKPHVFPVGSVIVKKKVDSRSGQPILYTVMTKRSRGYNPKAGDWEFAVVSADGQTLEASGKLENCMACHTSRPQSDFVFRTYIEAN